MTTPTTITQLRSTLLQIPWRGKPPAAGILSDPFREIYVLEIETQGGLIGMSYLQPLRGGLHTIDACMKELVAPHVIGRDATEIEAIWQTLYRSNFWLGRMGVTVFAQSAEKGALSQLFAATAPEAQGGQYIGPGGMGEQRGHPKVVQPVKSAQDPELAEQLWVLSEELTGVTFVFP